VALSGVTQARSGATFFGFFSKKEPLYNAVTLV
jgi:hypothetical protein